MCSIAPTCCQKITPGARIVLSMGVACLVTGVVLAILYALGPHEQLLFPSYCSFGLGTAFVLGVFIKTYCNKKKVNDGKQPVDSQQHIKTIITVPPAQLKPFSVRLHPKAIESLGTKRVKFGNMVYEAISSDQIAEHSIEITLAQRALFLNDIGLVTTVPTSFIVEPFKENVEPAEAVELKISVTLPRQKEQCLCDKSYLITRLRLFLWEQILRNRQQISVEMGNIIFNIEVKSAQEGYFTIDDRTKFSFLSSDIHIVENDPVNIEEVEIELGVMFSGKPERIEFHESFLKQQFAWTHQMNISSIKHQIDFLPKDAVIAIGDKKSLTYSYYGLELSVQNIKTQDGCSHSLAMISGVGCKPAKISIENPYVTMLKRPNPSRPKVNWRDVTPFEKGISVVQRLERRGIAGLPTSINDLFQPVIDKRLLGIKANYDKWCTRPHRGVILEGPAGTGKTSIAKQMCSILAPHVIKWVKGSQFAGWNNQAEKNIRSLFTFPERSSFFVIILEEAELFLSESSHGRDRYPSYLPEFLQQMENMEEGIEVFIIAITSAKEKIHPAFLQQGVFALPVNISLPDASGREAIFEIHLQKLREQDLLHKDIKLDELVNRTEKLSGADIKNTVERASARSLQRESAQHSDKPISPNSNQLTMIDLCLAIDEVKKIRGMPLWSEGKRDHFGSYSVVKQ